MEESRLQEEQEDDDYQIIEKALKTKREESSINPNPQNNKGNNYGVLTEILPYSDRREIKVEFKVDDIVKLAVQKDKREELLKETSEWLGMVYRATASICWNMLVNNYLNFDEVKILFTENIIFNFIEFMKEMKKIGK